MSLRIAAVVAALVVVVGILENVFFGSDTPGTAAHVISVGFYLAALAGIVALVVIGVAAIVRAVRRRTA